MRPRSERWAVAGAVLLAAALHATRLDAMSIWQDEGLSLYRASLDLAGILGGKIPLGDLVTADVHPPLYFLLLGGWFRLVGFGTWTGRWLSLAALLPTPALVWALGRRTVGRLAAVGAAYLAALSPLYLWYAQELRSYSLIVTLGVAAVYAAWRIGTGPAPPGSEWRSLRWLVPLPALSLVALAAALLWTHYLGFLLLPVLATALAAPAVRRPGRRLLLPLVATAVLAAPLVPFAAHRLRLGAETNQQYVPFRVMAMDVLGGFGFGRTLYHADALQGWQGWAVAALLGLTAALVGLGLLRALQAGPDGPPRAVLLGAFLVLPVVGVYAVSVVKPIYLGVYHLILASPPFYLLLSSGMVALWRLRRSWLALSMCVVAAMALADTNYFLDPAFQKDDLRGLAAYVDAHALPGDVLVLSDPVLERSFEHLARLVPVVSVPRMLATSTLDDRPPAQQLGPLLAEHHRLWIMSPLPEQAEWLDGHAQLVDRRTFHGATIPVRLSAYEELPGASVLPPPAGVAVPGARPVAAGATNLEGLQVMAWQQEPDRLLAGRAARVRLWWQATSTGLPDLKVTVRLLDKQGRDWAEGDHEPFHGLRPVSSWPLGQTVVEPHDLAVSPGAPPGEYTLALAVYDPAEGLTPAAQPLILGTVSVARPDTPPEASALPLTVAFGATGTALDVLGLGLGSGAVAPGGRLSVAVWLRARRQGPAAGTVEVDLTDRWSRTVRRASVSLSDEMGRDLQPGDLRRASVRLDLPTEAGVYGLRVRLRDGGGGVVWLHRAFVPVRGLWGGYVEVARPERTTTLPEGARRDDLAVGSTVTLVGDVASCAGLGPGAGPLPVALYWSARQPVPVAYHVTVQLVPVSAEGQVSGPPVAQHDGAPAGGLRPATGWQVGEVVEDRHALQLPAGLAGRFWLIAAVYDPDRPQDPRPLVLQDGVTRDFVVLDRCFVSEGSAKDGKP